MREQHLRLVDSTCGAICCLAYRVRRRLQVDTTFLHPQVHQIAVDVKSSNQRLGFTEKTLVKESYTQVSLTTQTYWYLKDVA